MNVPKLRGPLLRLETGPPIDSRRLKGEDGDLPALSSKEAIFFESLYENMGIIIDFSNNCRLEQ